MESSQGSRPEADEKPLLVSRSENVLEITLNRPHKRNAITPEIAQLMDDALTLLEQDDSLHVGLLLASGDTVFSAGADLTYIAEGRGAELSTERGGFAGVTRFPRTKPLVGAVSGLAVAGGFEIALACDILVADLSAQFSLPEVSRGLLANGGGVVRLPRVLPRPLAMDVILTGRRLTAVEAERWGLVSRLVEDGEATEVARSIAHAIAGLPQRAVRASIEVADLSLGNAALADVWATCAALAHEIRLSSEAVTSARAFLSS